MGEKMWWLQLPDNTNSESLQWHFGVKNPTLTGILCLVWLFPKTRSGGTTASFIITSPHSSQSHKLSSPSPKIHQTFPKSNILGVPRVKGTKATSTRMLWEPSGFCLGSHASRDMPAAGSTQGARAMCNEGRICCRCRIHPNPSNLSKDFQCPACVSARAGAALPHLCGYGALTLKFQSGRCTWGIRGIMGKGTCSPQPAPTDPLMGSVQKKGQAAKLAFKISLELLILLLLLYYNHFHNPSKSRASTHYYIHHLHSAFI